MSARATAIAIVSSGYGQTDSERTRGADSCKRLEGPKTFKEGGWPRGGGVHGESKSAAQIRTSPERDQCDLPSNGAREGGWQGIGGQRGPENGPLKKLL